MKKVFLKLIALTLVLACMSSCLMVSTFAEGAEIMRSPGTGYESGSITFNGVSYPVQIYLQGGASAGGRSACKCAAYVEVIHDYVFVEFITSGNGLREESGGYNYYSAATKRSRIINDHTEYTYSYYVEYSGYGYATEINYMRGEVTVHGTTFISTLGYG